MSEEMKPGAVDELYAVVDARTRAKKSTIVCAQYRVEGWPKRMGDYPAAESIVDRLKNNAYKVELKGEISMRERCKRQNHRVVEKTPSTARKALGVFRLRFGILSELSDG